MAAITPHLEQQDDPTETPAEQEWFDRITPEGLEGLGRDAGGGLRDEVLQTSHAELVRMQWLRQALVESIAGYYVRANVITEEGRLPFQRRLRTVSVAMIGTPRDDGHAPVWWHGRDLEHRQPAHHAALAKRS